MTERGIIILEKQDLQTTVGLREGEQIYHCRVKFREPFEEPPTVSVSVNGLHPFGQGRYDIDVIPESVTCHGFVIELHSAPGLGILACRLNWHAEAAGSGFRMMSRGELELAATPSEGRA